MKKLLFGLVIASVFSTTAMAVEIAISTQAGWWSQAAADTEMAKIVANVKSVPVRVFTATDPTTRGLFCWMNQMGQDRTREF